MQIILRASCGEYFTAWSFYSLPLLKLTTLSKVTLITALLRPRDVIAFMSSTYSERNEQFAAVSCLVCQLNRNVITHRNHLRNQKTESFLIDRFHVAPSFPKTENSVKSHQFFIPIRHNSFEFLSVNNFTAQ